LGVDGRGIEQCLAHEVENNFHFLHPIPNRPKGLVSWTAWNSYGDFKNTIRISNPYRVCTRQCSRGLEFSGLAMWPIQWRVNGK
jgi:hypothetical protein